MKVKIDGKTCPDSAVTVEDFPGDTGEASGGMWTFNTSSMP